MSHSRYQLSKDIWLDARRALWLKSAGALVVADMHLGYAWVQRSRGQLLPLAAVAGAMDRLLELQADYHPREIVFLGDVVHRAVPLPALKEELSALITRLRSGGSAVTLVAGNHDHGLGRLLAEDRLPAQLVKSCAIGPHLLIHGDDAEPGTDPAAPFQAARSRGGRIVMGHEHPAIAIGDGVASSVKCPCFLIGETVLILPAFSVWAAGTVVGKYPLMSSVARQEQFTLAVAIVGDKLLPIPL